MNPNRAKLASTACYSQRLNFSHLVVITITILGISASLSGCSEEHVRSVGAGSRSYAETSGTAPMGIRGYYYSGINFDQFIGSRIDDNIDFNWELNAPMKGVSADNFSVRWRGRIKPKFSETYTFTSESDDGIRVYIDGTRVIGNWSQHAVSAGGIKTGTIELKANQVYDLLVEFFDSGWSASVKLKWSSAHQIEEVIGSQSLPMTEVAKSAVTSKGGGMRGYFYDGLSFPTYFRGSRVDNAVDFAWGVDTPAFAGIGLDNFSVHWFGRIQAKYSETYTIKSEADDGMRVYIDGSVLIDNWRNNSVNGGGTRTATIDLVAGHSNDFVVEYFDSGWEATARVKWSSAHVPEQVIGPESLVSGDGTPVATPDPPAAPQPLPPPVNPPTQPPVNPPVNPPVPPPVVLPLQSSDDPNVGARIAQTIVIKNGTYNGYNLGASASGAPDAYKLYKAESKGGVIFTGNPFLINGAQYIVVQGVVVKSGYFNEQTRLTDGQTLSETAALRVQNSHHIVLEDVESKNNGSTGISTIDSHHVTIRGVTSGACSSHDNGRNGICGVRSSYVLVQNCDSFKNNKVQRYDAGFDGGGGKWVLTDHVVIDGGKWHDNCANGLWFVFQNTNYTIKNMEVYNNEGIGIVSEVNQRPGLITNNYCHDNKGQPNAAGIGIWETSNVVVKGNRLENNGKGDALMLRQGTENGKYRLPGLNNVSIINNTAINNAHIIRDYLSTFSEAGKVSFQGNTGLQGTP